MTAAGKETRKEIKKEKGPRKVYACLGDSITSEQVTGIGTRVCRKLQMELLGNFACGWASGSDWHRGDETLTTESLCEQPNCFAPENVLSNQVRRLLRRIEETGRVPDIVYIAVSANDGAIDWCRDESPVPLHDDTQQVCTQRYQELTRRSLASALGWAIETIRRRCPEAEIYAASPLQAYSPEHEPGAFSGRALWHKREIIRKICSFCGVHFIDSYYESGFTREIAKEHGQVHPDEEWAEKIAAYVAGVITDKRNRNNSWNLTDTGQAVKMIAGFKKNNKFVENSK